MLMSMQNKHECLKGREAMEGKNRLQCPRFLMKAFFGKQVGALKVLRTFIFIEFRYLVAFLFKPFASGGNGVEMAPRPSWSPGSGI